MSGVGNVSGQVMNSMANGAVGMSVLKKSMDQEESQLNDLLKSVAPQANPNVGNNLDVRG